MVAFSRHPGDFGKVDAKSNHMLDASSYASAKSIPAAQNQSASLNQTPKLMGCPRLRLDHRPIPWQLQIELDSSNAFQSKRVLCEGRLPEQFVLHTSSWNKVSSSTWLEVL